MLGGQNLTILVTHRGKVFEAFHDPHAAESAQRDAVARLTEREPGQKHRIQEIGFVDNPHLAARWIEMN